MPVEFEFQVGKGFHFLTAFAQHFNTKIIKDRVYLPETIGQGYIQHVVLDGFNLFVHNYKLKQELVLVRKPALSNQGITLKFDRSKVLLKIDQNKKQTFIDQVANWEVEIETCNVKSVLRMPTTRQINLIIIGITRQNLLDLLKAGDDGSKILDLLKNHPSFVIHEVISPEMAISLKQIIQIDSLSHMSNLLYKTKAQELIYYLFRNFLKRYCHKANNWTALDIEKIYIVRAALLRDLSKCPRLPELAKLSGLGISKLKAIFTQVFGKSTYHYFQSVRMMEAADLLNTLNVSETGYKLGFTNLSHFTRLFEKHHQMKPKQFKQCLAEKAEMDT